MLKRSIEAIGSLPATNVIAVSRLRDTEPVGIVDQPRFLNGAVALETDLEPDALLAALLALERALGRVREGVPAGGARTIDLDLLLYDERRIDRGGLEIPHPRLHERRFVLEPLADLDPALEVPGKGTVENLLARLDSAS
jgi:2-amino-4-hydroxy-6-hydroxymethyldihydropteridine diphosphokinase